MTEAEIMKALECCSKPVGEDCDECPLQSTNCLTANIEKEALDLINRKNAENEKVRTELDRLTIYFDEAVEAKLETARAEAIKELLTQADKKMIVVNSADGLETAYLEDDLLQIAKEMGVEL